MFTTHLVNIIPDLQNMMDISLQQSTSHVTEPPLKIISDLQNMTDIYLIAINKSCDWTTSQNYFRSAEYDRHLPYSNHQVMWLNHLSKLFQICRIWPAFTLGQSTSHVTDPPSKHYPRSAEYDGHLPHSNRQVMSATHLVQIISDDLHNMMDIYPITIDKPCQWLTQ